MELWPTRSRISRITYIKESLYEYSKRKTETEQSQHQIYNHPEKRLKNLASALFEIQHENRAHSNKI